VPFERRFISISEAAQYLGIHEQTAYEWVSLKLLPIIRLGKNKRTLRVD
jgi:excisionase family DNA binding protein